MRRLREFLFGCPVCGKPSSVSSPNMNGSFISRTVAGRDDDLLREAA